MSGSKITYYFDIISPFAYIAFHVLQMNDPDIKTLLTANMTRYFDSDAFGLPWFECTNPKGETESFWGVDNLGQVTDFLGLDRALDRGFRATL
ncbi:hypothetical protein N7449_010426 [Penicillium cf. viridicatum]|uniref:DSBA-like thioredoxin domain-containing protein n=1 Tax=Penicillium cf. viridicatum TaxID=2972119 RepID=A0A9W9M4Z0_9EURO|nr:hypothetical protein N7449_010426 [Penicillium cf. viridicatum]